MQVPFGFGVNGQPLPSGYGTQPPQGTANAAGVVPLAAFGGLSSGSAAGPGHGTSMVANQSDPLVMQQLLAQQQLMQQQHAMQQHAANASAFGFGPYVAPRRGGRGFEGQPFFSRPKNPGNGQGATTAQAAPV